MENCVGNIHTKNYQNIITGFQVTVDNVGDAFWDTVYIPTATDVYKQPLQTRPIYRKLHIGRPHA